MKPSLLFIPDISGFTEFVNSTEVAHSQHVIEELLELIIANDELGLTVSEIEGDAVLFYKEASVPPLEKIVGQTQRIFQAFHTQLKDFESRRICQCGACRTTHQLSLKIIAHAGPVEILSVREFAKPFGPDVILAHRLLKNDLESREYLLVTESTFESQGWGADQLTTEGAAHGWSGWCSGRSSYDEFGAVPYRYLPLGPLLDSIPDPPAVPLLQEAHRSIARDIYVDRPVLELFEMVSNLDLRTLWNTSVDELRYQANRVNRSGTRHTCVIDGDLIEFETVTNDFGEGRMVYGERLLEPPLVREAVVFYVLEEEGDGTRLRMEVHYRPQPFPGSLLGPLFRLGFGRRLPGTLRAIKEAAEKRWDGTVPGAVSGFRNPSG